MNPTLRVYERADREACLHLFRSNLPRFFTPSEEAEFAEFLDTEADANYFVVQDRSTERLVGCGGVFLRGDGLQSDGLQSDTAGLCWGMVDRSRHCRGIGTLLLRGRLEHLRAHYPQIKAVQLDTSQHSEGFFTRFGFGTTRVTPDGYGPGLDRHDMTLSREGLERLSPRSR